MVKVSYLVHYDTLLQIKTTTVQKKKLFKKPSKIFSKYYDDGTGISDFHKMVITVLKIFYKKQKLKIIHYRN